MHTLSNSSALFEQLWLLRPIGSHDGALFSFINTLNSDDQLTVEFLVEKYTTYTESLRQYQNGKYTKKQYTILDIEEWLDKRLYNQKIIVEKDPLDFYLYGI